MSKFRELFGDSKYLYGWVISKFPLARILTLLSMSLMSSANYADDHTWISTGGNTTKTDSAPSEPRASTDDTTLPPVIIIGPSINWGSGYFDQPFNETYMLMGSGGLGNAIASGRERAVDLASVCSNPLITSDSKSTTSTSDATTRWLAAQNLFSTTAASNMLSLYYQAMRISVIVDGKSFSGYKVTYADGWTEVWVVNPGHATSSFKLFDTPSPGSLKEPLPNNPGCQS